MPLVVKAGLRDGEKCDQWGTDPRRVMALRVALDGIYNQESRKTHDTFKNKQCDSI